MRLSRWLMLLACVVGLGSLQVAQRNAVFLKGYAIGERAKQVHAKERDVLWLNADVVQLASPVHLAQVVQEKHLNLVAWSVLSSTPSLASAASASAQQAQALEGAETGGTGRQRVVHIAAADPHLPIADDGASD